MVFDETQCMQCGIRFRYPRDFGVVRYCSALCRVSHQPPQHDWEYKGCTAKYYYSPRRRRTYLAGDKIDPLVVYEAYDWTCCLCRARIDPVLRLPDRMCATIEHLVPLSLGGTHTWDNVQPSHKQCNETKD